MLNQINQSNSSGMGAPKMSTLKKELMPSMQTMTGGATQPQSGLMNGPQSYTAKKGTVGDNQLVEKRVAGLMDASNPLMKKTTVNANNMSAQRGLQSSSIATENGVNAMFNYAMPIATADAKTYSDQSLMNQQNEQQAGIVNTQANNTFGLQKDQQGYQSGESELDRTFQTGLEDQRFNSNSALQNDQQDFQGSESLMAREQQTNLQAGQQEFQSNENMEDRKFTVELESIRLTGQKELQTDAQNFQEQLQKDMEGLRYKNSMGLLDAQGVQQLAQLEKQNGYAIKQIEKSGKIQSERDAVLQTFQEQNLITTGLQALAQIEQKALADATAQQKQNEFTSGEQDKQNTFSSNEQDKQNTYASGEQDKQNTYNEGQQDKQNNFAKDQEYRNSISNAINTSISTLGNAYLNPEIDPSQYTGIQKNLEVMVQGQILDMAEIYGYSDSGDQKPPYVYEPSTPDPDTYDPVEVGPNPTSPNEQTPPNNPTEENNPPRGGRQGGWR